MFYKLFTFFLSIHYLFTPYVAPAATQPIENLSDSKVKLTYALWGDPQISNYLFEREPVFRAASEDLANAKDDIDALVLVGDIAENGLECEYDIVTNHLKGSGIENYLFATGNHDVRLRLYKQVVKRFTGVQNNLNKDAGSDLTIDKLNYSYKLNGYTFIVMGTDRTEFEEAYFGEEQLKWLDDTLAANAKGGKPVFVVIHQPLELTHGLPLTWGNGTNKRAGHVGEQSDELQTIMNKYKNVFMISGHLHTGLGEYNYEKIGNFHSINVPSISIENKDGDYNNAGIGYMVEVYSNKVVFRARDFAAGVYLPDYDIEIKLK